MLVHFGAVLSVDRLSENVTSSVVNLAYTWRNPASFIQKCFVWVFITVSQIVTAACTDL